MPHAHRHGHSHGTHSHDAHMASDALVDDQGLVVTDDSEQVQRRQLAGRRVTWISVAVNVLLSVVQIVTGILARSQGLVADGIHSLSDLVSDFVVLLAIHYSKNPADADHHYGHQRYENLASMIVGLLLLAVGLGMIWQSVIKLQAPETIAVVHGSALWVALIALIGKELLFRYMLRVGQQLRSSMLIANAWHARSDAASSLVVAIGIAGNLLGYPLLDPIAALIVGFMIGRMGWQFSYEALQDLSDRATDEATTEAIRADILAVPGILGVHELKTRKSGDMILVDAHLEIDGQLTVRQGHDIAAMVVRQIKTRHPVLHMMTHVDPV